MRQLPQQQARQLNAEGRDRLGTMPLGAIRAGGSPASAGG